MTIASSSWLVMHVDPAVSAPVPRPKTAPPSAAASRTEPTTGRLEIRHRYSRRLLRALKIKSLSRKNLSGISLNEASLVGFDLRYADLHGASLVRTDLREANLSGANLCGADLSQASLEGARLCGALYDSATVWPIGVEPSTLGAVRIKQTSARRTLRDEDNESNEGLRGRFVASLWGRWVVRLN